MGVEVGIGLGVAVGSGASVGNGVAVGRGVAVSMITIVGVGAGILVGGAAVGAVGGVGVCVGRVKTAAPGLRGRALGSSMEFKTSIPMMATKGMRDAAPMAAQVPSPTPRKREWRVLGRSGSCDDVAVSRCCEVGSGIVREVWHGANTNLRFYCRDRARCARTPIGNPGGHLHSTGRRRG